MSDKSKHTKGKEIELAEKPLVLYVPEDSVEATVTVVVYIDGELQTVEKKLSMSDIREGFRDCEENYIPEDAMFTLTEKGRAYLDSLESGV